MRRSGSPRTVAMAMANQNAATTSNQCGCLKSALLLLGIIGLSGASAPALAIGPSYDCAAPGLPPGAKLICSSPELSRLDLAYAQAYYVMRQVVGPAGWQNLKLATIAFENDASRQCGVPLSGAMPAYTQPLITCLGQAWEQHKMTWLAGLVGAP